MIKLIASDMDGTLLDGEGNVPPETFDLIKRLKTAGIGFVASSGRRFDTLQELFAPVSSEMDFVASNGAQVVVAGQLVDREVFSHAALRRLKNVTDLFDGLHLVVFDKISYLLDDEERFERELDKNLPNPLRVRDLPRPDTSIIKASIYVDDAVMDMAYILEREMGEDFVFAPSGRKWIDVMQHGVSKATGIKQVMEARHARAEEVVAFGDSMNDSFAAKNARISALLVKTGYNEGIAIDQWAKEYAPNDLVFDTMAQLADHVIKTERRN